VLDTVYAFAPNRDTQGGTAYFIVNNTPGGQPANLLIDAPAWDQGNREWLVAQGGVQWLFITHRGGLGRAATLQKTLDCAVVIQELEAYLLPDTPFTIGLALVLPLKRFGLLATRQGHPASYTAPTVAYCLRGGTCCPIRPVTPSLYAWLKPSIGRVNSSR
jgi:hypothetical protein